MAKKMTDAEVGALVARRRDDAVNFTRTEFQQARQEALRFYRGDPLGDEVEGASSVISRDVMEAIEAMLPGLIRPFVSGDETVRFEPKGPEDEEGAKQSTEYVNYLFNSNDESFLLLYNGMKDGLLQRLGVARVDIEDDERADVETYQGLDEAAYTALMQDEVEPVGEPMLDPMSGLISVQVRRVSMVRKIVTSPVAPDEFLFDRQLASMDRGTFFGQRVRRPVFELIDMGLPKDKCMRLSEGDDLAALDDERLERFREDGWGSESNPDQLTREVWVTDCFIRMDADGDGYPEWRRVVLGGSASEVLLNEPVDGHPFVAWTPIPIPHKFVGLSIFDVVRELQLIKTALWRETLDNLYLHNRPQREVVEGQVNIDDLLNPRVGGVIRVKAPNMVQTNQVPSIVGNTMPMIEYADTVREARTGSTRYNQGMDADSLNKTATGISAIMTAAQQRLELIARQFAEQFMKRLFRRYLELICKNPDMAKVVRLRGQWVPVDPRSWKSSYDMSIAVGLGTGDKTQIVGQLMQLLQIDQQIIMMQGGPNGPLVTLQNLYEKLKRIAEAMGLKGIENYYTEPGADGEPQQPEGPSPEQMAAEAQQQSDAAKLEAESAKAQLQAQVELQKAQLQAETQLEIERMKAEVQLAIAGGQQDLEGARLEREGEREEAVKADAADGKAQIQALAAAIERLSRPRTKVPVRDPETGLLMAIREIDEEEPEGEGVADGDQQ